MKPVSLPLSSDKDIRDLIDKMINHRKEQGLTQLDVAKAMGYSSAANVIKIERSAFQANSYKVSLPAISKYIQAIGYKPFITYAPAHLFKEKGS